MKFLNRDFTWFEKASMLISAYFLFFPKPYEVAFITVISIPILGFILNRLKGKQSILTLFRIQKDYSLTVFVKYPAIAILIRILLEFELEDNYNLISPSITSFCIIMLIIFITHKIEVPSDINYLSIYIPLVFFVGIYSVAITFGINCVFDKSNPAIYKSKVIDKEYFSRKGNHYYIVIEPYGEKKESKKISVTSDEYSRAQVGKTVDIIVNEGVFKIPWFYIN